MLTDDQLLEFAKNYRCSHPGCATWLDMTEDHFVNVARSIEQASRRAALEEAAKECDEIAADCWSLYKGRAPYTGREAGRADPHVQGESDGADKCAAAIRGALAASPTIHGDSH